MNQKFIEKLPILLTKQFFIVLVAILIINSIITFIPKESKINFLYTDSETETISVDKTKLTSHNFSTDNKVIKLDIKTAALVRFLRKYNSPIASPKYAKIIIKTSELNGADYRLNAGIMLAESGLCKKPVKSYNCYGFLDKVQYNSFEDGLRRVTTKVSQRYTSKFAWNTTSMGEAYGVHNVPSWEKKVRLGLLLPE